MDQSNTTGALPLLPLGQLDALAIEAETDKSSLKHDYLRFYEYLLKPYKDKKFTLLELGVGIPSRKAPSLRTWKSFFSKAQIVGLDIRKVSKDFEEDRIAVEIGDASDRAFLERVFDTWKPAVIIDDASHFWSHQIIGFKTLFPHLPANGIYIVEDIHTSFVTSPENSDYADHDESFWSFISRLQSSLACAQHNGPDLNAEEAQLVAEIDVILLSRKTVAIIKRSEPRRKEQRIARRKRQQEQAV
jgi:hypothetical protein